MKSWTLNNRLELCRQAHACIGGFHLSLGLHHQLKQTGYAIFRLWVHCNKDGAGVRPPGITKAHN